MTSKLSTGGCYCGAVRYRIAGALRGVVNCHCSQCQKLNGNYGAHSKCDKENLSLDEESGLSWFKISDNARRGFCKLCGSPLFWDAIGQPGMGIIAGSLDSAEDLETIGHIFFDEKPGYTIVSDSVPKFAKSSDGELPGDHNA